MRIIIAFLTMVMISGCWPILGERDYNSVGRMPGEVEKLKQSDEQLREDIRSIKDAMDMMEQGMHKQISDNTASVAQVSPKSIQVTLQQQLLFESGSSKISPDGRELLKHFAEGVRNGPSSTKIRIVGHTDNLPIGRQLRARYTDNWELSAVRAAAVARALIWGENISQNRFHIEASGAIAPVADNTSEEGRTQNRRIELYLEDI